MKKIVLILFLISLTHISSAQDKIQNDEKTYFVVLYTTGESWDDSLQFHEQVYFKEHSAHLSELRKSNTIITGGRYSDTGMIIIRANNETHALELITSDHAIKNKLFNASIFPYSPFYKGCIELN